MNKNQSGLEYGEITEGIIGAAIHVHKAIGPGFLESIYENALVVTLKRRVLLLDNKSKFL